MVYKKYGEIFRRLREQQHVSLSSFTCLGISKAALSKFERGENMMGFEKVVSALQLLGFSLEEFELFLNNYSSTEPEEILKEICDATILADEKYLRRISQTAVNSGFPLISLAAKSSLGPLNPDEIQDLTNYLYEIEVWSYKDLCIFYFTMENLSSFNIMYIIDLFLVAGHPIISGRYRDYLIKGCCRAITILVTRGYKEYPRYIIDQLESPKMVHSMFLRNLINMAHGYWQYRFEDKNVGNQKMLNSLNILQNVSTPAIHAFYLKRYNRFVNKKTNKEHIAHTNE